METSRWKKLVVCTDLHVWQFHGLGQSLLQRVFFLDHSVLRFVWLSLASSGCLDWGEFGSFEWISWMKQDFLRGFDSFVCQKKQRLWCILLDKQPNNGHLRWYLQRFWEFMKTNWKSFKHSRQLSALMRFLVLSFWSFKRQFAGQAVTQLNNHHFSINYELWSKK